MARIVDTSDAWIRERTGIGARRFMARNWPLSEGAKGATRAPIGPRDAGTTGGQSNSDLGLEAARAALAMAGKTANDVDQIIYATCTPDTPIPSSACWLQAKLGAKRAWGMDLNAACTGFLYALTTARQFIATGQSRCVVVVGAEVLSRYMNWKDRTSCVLFGDGAGAVIVERCEAESPRQILSTHTCSDGSMAEHIWIPAGGSNCAVSPAVAEAGLDKVHLKGQEVYKLAVRMLTELASEALSANGLTVKDLDWFIPHQANSRIIEAVADRLGIDRKKVLTNIERFGNTSSATVPTMLDEAVRDGRVKAGQTVLMDVFGGGLTWGSLLLRW